MTGPGFEPLRFDQKQPEKMAAASRYFHAEMKRRHTVRDFSDRPVPDEVIRNALRAAGIAPIGANIQPWHFAVVSDSETKKEVRGAAEAESRAFYQGRAPDEWPQALRPLSGLVTGYPASNAEVPVLSKHALDQIASFC